MVTTSEKIKQVTFWHQLDFDKIVTAVSLTGLCKHNKCMKMIFQKRKSRTYKFRLGLD